MLKKTKRPSAGTIIGTVALVFAISGAAVALPGKNKVNSGDIRNGQVKTLDLSKKAVAPKVKTQSASAGNTNLPAQSSDVTVLSKPVPAGKYAITAKLNLFNNGDDDQSCELEVGGVEIDEARVNSPNGVGAHTQPIGLVGTATAPAGNPIEVVCSTATDIGSADDVQLIAIPTL
jgi:hypothetical protein